MADRGQRSRPIDVEFGTEHLRVGGGGQIGTDLLLACRFPVVVHDPALKFRIEMTVAAINGHLAVESYSIEQEDGPAVAIDWRVNRGLAFGVYLREIERQLGATMAGAFLVTKIIRKTAASITGEPTTGVSLRGSSTGRRYRRSDDAMSQVVNCYREARSSPDPKVRRAATQYVIDRMDYSPGHTRRLLTAARKAGLLGPAIPGRAGEKLD